MKWYASTEAQKWFEPNSFSAEAGSELQIGEPSGNPLFGFGCCISELGAKALLELPEAKKNEVFDELFGPAGCGFNYGRLSIGANDFAESWYSYNETEGDYAMVHFSIDRDRKYILPAIHEAMKRSPGLSFFASPWSPPTWMKYPKVYNFGNLVMTDENLKAYALYFRKFVEAFRAEGVNVKQVCPQNEVFADQKFPSCVFNSEDLEKLTCVLIDELGRDCDVFYGTLNGPEYNYELDQHYNYLGRVMQNPKIRENIKGAAFQWAGKQAIMQAQEDYPTLPIIHSEQQCGDGRNTWDFAMYGYGLYHHYFRFGASANVYWNMALEGDSVSTWGWKQNSLIVVKDGDYTYTPDFYMVKHFSHAVQKGAVMLSTKGNMSSNATVFRNPDGSIVAVIMNPYNFEKTVTIAGTNYCLAPRSFNTILL